MFLRPPATIQPWMRPTYFALSVLLGVIISYGLHAVIELWWLSYAQRHNLPITWSYHFGQGLCALPPILQYGLPVFGALAGFFTGRLWWRWVYVERKWEKRR